MQPDPTLLRFMEARRRFFEELEKTRRRLDRVLEAMSERQPTMADLALLEGLHAEKHQLFMNFVKTEDEFVNELLRTKRTQPNSSEGTA